MSTNTTVSEAYRRSQKILGNDLITPEEVMDARFGVVYTADQMAEFEKTLPTLEELKWLRDNGFMLVPGPAEPMSLLDIRELNPSYFYSKSGGWYDEPGQWFSREQMATPKWLKLRKTEVPNSIGKTWKEQTKLLSEMECIPSGAEVVWGVTTYKAVRDVYLLNVMSVRTSCLCSKGGRIYVGRFDPNGLYIEGYWGDDYERYDKVGVVSARK